MSRVPVLHLVCPCYNEEEVVEQSISVLNNLIDNLAQKGVISAASELILVDDGSADRTWELIQKHKDEVHGIKFIQNYGQFTAIYCGYCEAYKCGADICISLDVDLQEDISIIPEMIEQWRNGFDIVQTARRNRENDTEFKRVSSTMFYNIELMLGCGIPYNSSDYRLLSRKALKIITAFKDKKPVTRALATKLKLKSCIIEFDRKDRIAGETKYNLKMMTDLAIKCIVKTTDRPLYIGILGMIASLFSKKDKLNWFLVFLTLLVYGVYLKEIQDQVYDFPIYIVDEVI